MSVELIKFAFVAGELSPTLYGRSDLEKFDLGLALARNFFVDYRGGLSNRPGTEFGDYIKADEFNTKFVTFKFAPNLANTYVILFGQGYIRFIQDNAYVVEDAVPITGISQANPGVVTAANSLTDGDWIYLDEVEGMTEVNDRLFQVAGASGASFQLNDPFGNSFDTSALSAYVSGGNFYRVYTLVSPYDESELPNLKAYQRRDLVRLTINGHPIRNLKRIGHTNWTLTEEDIGNGTAAPTGLSGAGSDTGTASVGFVVTAVVDGEESRASEMEILTSIVDYAATAGSATLEWDAVAGAQYYNVYRTIIQSGAGTGATDITKGAEVGYVGRAYGPTFTDNNIIPDFVKTPPRFENPFANGAITAIEITNGGSGYDNADAVEITDPTGTGFEGFPVVDDGGAVVAVVIMNGGEGYTAPVVSFTPGGSGATATLTVGPDEGNDPGVSAIFQQRQVYGATANDPLNVYGSRPGLFSNFDTSLIGSASDAFSFEVESEEVAPILHMIPTRGGLLLMSQVGVWLLTSGSTEQAVTATQALADPQSYRGSSPVPPILVDTDILYIEGKSPTVRLLSYNEYSKVYGGQDMSILSNHLFPSNKRIVSWAYAQNPFNLIQAVRSDGALLSFTLVKEQDVYAWTQLYTKGLFTDAAVVQESGRDSIYVVVKRLINGRWTKFFERFAPREFADVEEAWFVDCGLRRTHTYPTANLQPSAATGTVTFTADAAVFSADDVGKVLRVGGGKATITSFTSTTVVTGELARPITSLIPEDADNTPLQALEGEWTLDAPISSISLPHLIGQSVVVLADGNVISATVDEDGEVALGGEATEVIAGLPYRCVARSLSPSAGDAVLEGKRKRIVGLAARVNQSRGMKIGMRLDNLFEVKERTTEAYNEPTRLQDGTQFQTVPAPFEIESQVYFVQDYPLPLSLLGFVTDLEIGDDTNPSDRP